MKKPHIANYGCGVDSTAMLVGFAARGEIPDLILFSDTGGEKPETYAYLATMDAWLASVGFPSITRVKYQSTKVAYDTLEDNMSDNETMPSMAWGRGGCSLKFKAEVMDAWIMGKSRGPWKGTGWAPFHEAHAAAADKRAAVAGPKAAYDECLDEVTDLKKAVEAVKGSTPEAKAKRAKARKLVDHAQARAAAAREHVAALHAELAPLLPMKSIGYDDSPADRKRSKRVANNFDLDFAFNYPLQEWGWTRERCIAEIEAAGLPPPIKSACFFCPASQKWEIKWLAAKYPALFLRAIAMEDLATVTGRHAHKSNPEGKIGCGLGMTFKWRTYAEAAGFLDGGKVVGDPVKLMASALSEKPGYEANTGLVQIGKRAKQPARPCEQ
ncbi:MAG TPA: hypothetical protein VMY39_02805, partial [Planctomycetota bacterium]|nr:hypothetical protein [Planctomycetota bacterium]